MPNRIQQGAKQIPHNDCVELIYTLGNWMSVGRGGLDSMTLNVTPYMEIIGKCQKLTSRMHH